MSDVNPLLACVKEDLCACNFVFLLVETHAAEVISI